MYDVVIVRYDEIALKSPPVRRRFEKILIANIKTALLRHGITYSEITEEWGRIFVHTKNADAADVIARVFGTASASPAITTEATLESAVHIAAQIGNDTIKNNQSFAIRASRAGIHDFTSLDIARVCGDAVRECTSSRVDLTDPDQEIFIDMRQKHAYLYTMRAAGAGGLPYSSQGKMIALVSGGIDSPVAAWLMMKRGTRIIPLYYDLGAYADPSSAKNAERNINRLWEWSYSDMLVYRIPYGACLREIIEKCNPRMTCVMCRRMMYRIAMKIAEKEDGCGIITGCSLGQVASQTAKNMFAEMYGLGIPIYHPLIGLDKREIIDRAINIGVFPAEKPAIECAAVPEHPITAATATMVLANEERIDVEGIVSDAVSGSHVLEWGRDTKSPKAI
ncbi:MAG: tRNA uracil 4-sulfurtransferase ThiI [Euryarchaeota archaeon]|nr:tRNA uracil 4-sulfurtransferase ThiI [Euryarchaeota archaeon]